MTRRWFLWIKQSIREREVCKVCTSRVREECRGNISHLCSFILKKKFREDLVFRFLVIQDKKKMLTEMFALYEICPETETVFSVILSVENFLSSCIFNLYVTYEAQNPYIFSCLSP